MNKSIWTATSDDLINDSLNKDLELDVLIIGGGITGINCLCIFVISLLYNYLVDEYTTIFLLIVLGLVIIFVFLYFTYVTFKLLNNIVLKQEHLQKKNYKKL